MAAVAHMVGLSWFQARAGTIAQLDIEKTAETKNNVPLGTPVISDIAWRVLNHSHPDIAKRLNLPDRCPSFTGMFGRFHLRPLCD